jgi:hypothetical protein
MRRHLAYRPIEAEISLSGFQIVEYCIRILDFKRNCWAVVKEAGLAD